MKRSLLMGVCALALATTAPAFAFDGWHQENATTIKSGTSAFDYVNYDPGTNKIFIGHRKEGAQVFNPATHRLIKTLGDTAAHSSNGVTLMPDLDLGVANCEDGTMVPFKLSTLKEQPDVKIAEDLDASYYDPATKRLFSNTDDGVVVVQAPELKVLQTIKLASKKAEGATADGKGHLLLAEQDLGKIAVIDTKDMKVTGEWPTPGCAKPTSVTTDPANNRLFVGCRSGGGTKPALLVMNMDNGNVVYAGEIGDGVDGIAYDADLKRIFVPGGVNATLSVFEQDGADSYKPVETLATRQWVKVIAMDHKAKKLYSIVAEASADASKKILTQVSPFYPNTVFPNTFTVLTYSK